MNENVFEAINKFVHQDMKSLSMYVYLSVENIMSNFRAIMVLLLVVEFRTL